MATIQTAIELTDRMTAPLHGILNALNLTISGFQDMQNTAAQDIDTSSIEAAREQINQATMALHELEASGINVPINTPDVIVPEPLIEQPAPVEVPISWQSSGEVPISWQSSGMDIFTNSGIERFESEIQSANNMLNTLHTTQQQISDTAAQTDLFPDNMVADLNSVNSRIQRIQSIIQQIERNPINQVASDEVNNGLERLRSRLNQAVEQQRELNQAMEEMDISNANAAYDQLQNTISETEMYLRDNVDEQGRFNQRIQEGQKHADSLLSTVKKMAAAYLSVQTARKAINLSDTLSQTGARLSMIVDDGGSVQELENKIFASAQRSRANYLQTADVVAKLGLRAGEAFSSNAETIQFAENLNKQFIIAGASQQEMASASLQLTQALG
jgi:transcriptional regulator